MTCKDCIHEKVCDALIKSGCPYLDEEVPADAFCMEFRNTADVVPKSEVENLEKETFEKIFNEIKIYLALDEEAFEDFKKDIYQAVFEE